MGQVTVVLEGSFGKFQRNVESAEEGGHAAAIGRSVQFLTEQLPEAIRLDHKLHRDGQRPPRADFGETK